MNIIQSLQSKHHLMNLRVPRWCYEDFDDWGICSEWGNLR